MKKILLLLLVIFIYSSCSSDDEQPQNDNNSKIIGSWKITEYHDSQFNNITEVEANDEPCFSLQTSKYNSDNKLNFYYKYGNNCLSSGVTNKTFSIEDNVLTQTIINGGYEPNKDYVVKYIIEELNSNILKLTGIYVDEGVSNSNTNTSTDPFYETWERID